MNNDKKHSVSLTVIEMRAYKQLRSLIAPAKPGGTDFAMLSKAMQNHYAPAPSEIVQRFRFNSRFHQPGESVVFSSNSFSLFSSHTLAWACGLIYFV